MDKGYGLSLIFLLFGILLLFSFVSLVGWIYFYYDTSLLYMFSFSFLLLSFFMLLIGYIFLELFEDLKDFSLKIVALILIGLSTIFMALNFIFLIIGTVFPATAGLFFALVMYSFLTADTIGTGLIGAAFRRIGGMKEEKSIKSLGDLFIVGSLLTLLFFIGIPFLFMITILGSKKLRLIDAQ